MSDAKLMLPLFYNGMFNRDGRKIRAVHNYDVSNGEYSYRLWTQAGQPDMDYPRSESDRYLLYVEIQGYLVPLGMTEYRLTERCGYTGGNLADFVSDAGVSRQCAAPHAGLDQGTLDGRYRSGGFLRLGYLLPRKKRALAHRSSLTVCAI